MAVKWVDYFNSICLGERERERERERAPESGQ